MPAGQMLSTTVKLAANLSADNAQELARDSCLIASGRFLSAVVLLMGMSSAAVAVTVTASPATCSSVAGIGTVAWTNPTRAVSSNNSFATASVDGTTTRFLQCSGYGFAIPAGATIDGITVNVERKSSSTANGGSADAAMRLVKAGTIGATDNSTGTTYTTSDVTEAHGSSTDLWGTTWTVADINNANFGAAFAATKASGTGGAHTVSVDHVQIVVDYTLLPVVSSINLASADPTSPAASVSWTVDFSTGVTGVDAADFALVQAGGVSGAAITSVTGSGSTWTVTANTGSGTGTLGLNLVDNDTIADGGSIPLGGAGAGNGSFTGQIYTVSPPFCSPPSNIPVGVTVTCQCDTFGRAALNPSTIFGGNWVATTSDATGIVPRIVNSGYLRLTESTGNNAKAATVPGIFPAAGNYISVEFKHYAYNGSGADGIAVTLSDYAVPAQPGAFGGSLGYANQTSINGFAGGWIGVALDEYGNYQNPTEGRHGGPGFIVQSVGVRGSGSGLVGYPWLKGTANLTTVAPNVGIDNRTSTTPSLGDFYQVIVDSRGNNGVSGPALVSVNRDITGVGTAYSPLIAAFDAYAAATAVGYTQAPVPQNWQVSFTGSTGGSTNIHEIGALRICAQTIVPTTGGTPGGFNGIDEAYTRSDVNAVSGHLYTKLAGTAFTMKVAALNAAGSGILTTYAFSGSKTVTVKLIDDSVGASCNASAAACSACGKPVVASQTMTFASGDTGFKQSGNFTVPAYANLLVQMSDGTTTGCSVDTFAVRPSGIAVTSSNATNTATTGTPIFKAGSDNFSLTATTTAISGNSGYAGGVPKINSAAVTAASPATVAGALSGSFAAAISGASSATATGSTFIYSEVGAFNLLGPNFAISRIPGVYDDAWTAIDSGAKNDCISGTTAAAYSNTKDANGKYGCNFGISANSGAFGRFVPDHFDTVVKYDIGSRVFMSCPSGLTCPASGDLVYGNGFVYSGQPFTAQVTARNAAGAVTLNYDSARTLSNAVTLSAWDTAGGATANPGGGTLSPGAVPSTAFNLGVATTSTPTYTFPTTPVAPTDIHVRAEYTTDSVTSLRGVSSIEGGIKVVSGRVKIFNAHGSELLSLPMTAAVQYWNATNWVTSTTDDATSFNTATDIAASIVKGPLAGVSVAGAGAVTVAGGVKTFTLNKPLVSGSADISLGAPAYLLAGSNVAAVNPSKTGRATFGVYKGANEFIYLRENY